MQKKSILISTLVLIVAVAILFIVVHPWGGRSVASGSQTANIAASAAVPANSASSSRPFLPPVVVGTPFSASPYSAHAYFIPMTGTMSTTTQQALIGFQVNRQALSGGSFKVQIVSLQVSAAPQIFTVASGDKLYFVENSLLDDAGGSEHFAADDFGILVGANGMILQ